MNRILDQHPGYLEHLGYEHIVVDEFQDSNDTQLETISRLIECDCLGKRRDAVSRQILSM